MLGVGGFEVRKRNITRDLGVVVNTIIIFLRCEAGRDCVYKTCARLKNSNGMSKVHHSISFVHEHVVAIPNILLLIYHLFR